LRSLFRLSLIVCFSCLMLTHPSWNIQSIFLSICIYYPTKFACSSLSSAC
jgi:hypothetical protein